MRLVLAALWAAFLSLPALAGDCPAIEVGARALPPMSAEALLKGIAGAGDSLLADVPVPGRAHLDRLVVSADAGGIWLWVLGGGCVLGAPLFLADPPAGAAPSSTPARPKPVRPPGGALDT